MVSLFFGLFFMGVLFLAFVLMDFGEMRHFFGAKGFRIFFLRVRKYIKGLQRRYGDLIVVF